MSPERRRSFPALALGLLLVAGLIKLAGIIKGDALVFPGVTDILRAFFDLLRTPATWVRVSVTLWDLLRALLVSAVLGIGLGVFEALSPFVRTLLQPLTHLLRALPMIVLVIAVMVLSPYRHVPPICLLYTS